MNRSFKLFGTFEITENGRLAPIMKSAVGRALLAYLIITDGSQPRATIASLLWAGSSRKQANANLRRLLNRLRPIAPELTITSSTLAFQANGETSVDLHQLRQALNSQQPEQRDLGLRLYSDDLLATFYLDDQTQFNEWLTIEREQLRLRIFAAYEQLLTDYYNQASWDLGIDAARRYLRLDDLNEPACRWLMKFLAQNGQLAAAQEQYELCRTRLWDELAIEPEEDTRLLAETLAMQAPEQEKLVLPAAVLWQPDPLPDPNTLVELGALPPQAVLPYQRNEHFTGREADLIRLGQWLLPWEETEGRDGQLSEPSHLQSPTSQSRSSTVAITGMGGLGKTQLAVEFVYRYGRFYAGGVFWLSFAQAESIADQVAQLGAEHGMRLYAADDKLTLADKIGRVQQAWQEPVPRLLIFDNCEEEEALERWLPVSGGCHVLLTSRRGQWATTLHVTTHPLRSLGREESVRLLKKTVNKIKTDAAAELAAEVGDLPLALHLASSFLQRSPTVSVAKYLEQLRGQGLLQHPSLQGQDSSESPTGHDLHVARTFALNFSQLDSQDEVDVMARSLLASAVAFAHGEPIPQPMLLDALLVEPDDFMAELLVVDGLARLITLGFLTESAKKHVQIHRLIAAYATTELKELVAKGETAVSTHLLQKLTDQFAKTLFTGQLPLAAAHLQKMATSGLARGDALGSQVAFWWGRHLRDAGNPQAAYSTLTEAVALRRTLFPDGDLVLAEQLSILGTIKWEQGRNHEAWPDYEETVAIRQRLLGKNHTLTAQSIQNLAILHSRSGSFEAAKKLYQQALRIYETITPPDLMQIGRTMSNLGLLYRRMNDLVAAEAQFKRALDTWDQRLPPDSPHRAITLSSIGGVVYLRGDYEAARTYHERSLAIRIKTLGRNHRSTSIGLVNLGMIATQEGQFEQALAYYQEGLAFQQTHLPPDDPNIGNSLSYIGRNFFLAGKPREAKQYLVEALAVQEINRPNQPPTATTLVYLGKVALLEADFEAARAYFERATSIQEARLAPEHIKMVEGIIGRGDLAAATGELAAARQLYERAQRILEKTAVSTHPDLITVQKKLAELK
ncbi:MAG: tetratricopeptide repeat protein [Chloroflexota bacterium]